MIVGAVRPFRGHDVDRVVTAALGARLVEGIGELPWLHARDGNRKPGGPDLDGLGDRDRRRSRRLHRHHIAGRLDQRLARRTRDEIVEPDPKGANQHRRDDGAEHCGSGVLSHVNATLANDIGSRLQ